MGAGEALTIYGPTKISSLSSKGWNDKISSMKVFRLATYEPVGYWNHVQTLYGSGSVTFSVTHGITYTDTVETEESLSESISTSVSEGFEFEGVSASIEVSETET